MCPKEETKVLEVVGPAHEMDVFIEVGFDKEMGRKCPIGRSGAETRMILFRRDHHNYLKPGEVWRCNVVENMQSYLIVAPFKRIQASPVEMGNPNNQVERVPPEVATTIVNALEDRIVQLRRRFESDKSDLGKFLEERMGLDKIIKEAVARKTHLDGAYDATRDSIEKLTDSIKMYEKQIARFTNMATGDDVSIEEIEQEAGTYGIPDYWGEMTKKEGGGGNGH